MGRSKIDWLSIVSLAVTVLLGVFKDETNSKVIYPIIAVIVVVFLANLVLSKTKANKNLSNTAVIAKSKKYTKYLWKLVKTNKKQMAREVELSELKKIERNNRKVLSLMDGGKSEQKYAKIEELRQEKRKLLKKMYRETTSYVDDKNMNAINPINEIAEMANETQARKVCRAICKTIISLQRILLQLEQHNLRIKLGKYVVTYSDDIDQVITAYVDFLGWTLILLGDDKKGIEYVKMGIEYIDYKLGQTKDGTDEHYKYSLLKARALRHIGTTYYTYKSKEDTFVKECLDEAKAICVKIRDDDKDTAYLAAHPSFNSKLDKMEFGIDYNALLYDYYVALANKDKSGNALQKICKGINAMHNSVEGFDVDEHRKVKILTFKNQIERNIMVLGEEPTKEQYDAWWKEYDKDLKDIEDILSKNIYFDEAMEVYIYQKIQGLYYNVEKIFEKK